MGIIGEELRTAREKKKLTLLDVEESTKIRVKYLEAIENEEFDIIPGKVYIKGFLKNYAEFLGLDSCALLQVLNDSNKENEVELVEENYNITPTLAYSNNFINTKNIFVITGLICIIILGLYASKFYGSNNKKINEANNLPRSTTPKSTDVSKAKNNINDQKYKNKSQEISKVSNKEVIVNQTLVKPSLDAKVNLVLTAARESSWALIKVDGIQKFIGTIKKNQAISFGGQNNIYIRLGNAGAVDIIYNGNKVEPIGPLHKVSKKTFTVSGIK